MIFARLSIAYSIVSLSYIITAILTFLKYYIIVYVFVKITCLPFIKNC